MTRRKPSPVDTEGMTMLTAITYNCDPSSLADVEPEAFADAFTNVVRARPEFRSLMVTVTFRRAASEVTMFASDDPAADMTREDEFRERFADLAEQAFAAC